MSITRPVVNLGEKYIMGLQMTYTSSTDLIVETGQCRDSTNTTDIVISEAAVLDINLSGVGGLDAGTLTLGSLYAVYVIDSSYGAGSPGVIMSLNQTQPVFPPNYDVCRRVGAITVVDFLGNGAMKGFFQLGNSTDREMIFVTPVNVVSSSNETSYTAVDVSLYVPAGLGKMNARLRYTPASASNEVRFKSAYIAGGGVTQNFAPSAAAEAVIQCPIYLSPNDAEGHTISFDYRVDNAGDDLDVLIVGYTDYL